MIKRKLGIVMLMLCICFRLMPLGAQATTIADAVEAIIPEKECSLTVSYCCAETAFSGAQVELYRVAEVSAGFHYMLTQPFVESRLILNGIKNNSEWNVIRSSLESYILAAGIAPDAVSETDENGRVHFDALKTGMYLAVIGQATQGDVECVFDAALVALPGLGQDGRWQYAVSVNAKGEILPPADADEETEFKVLKLWKGDEGRSDRPEYVTVEIFRDGIRYQTVTLSEANHWSYTWSAKDDGAKWSVAERNVPDGYTVTVDVREASFVLTNTWIPDHPDEPGDYPQTGDTSNIMFYVLVMTVSGAMLVVLGITRKRVNT